MFLRLIFFELILFVFLYLFLKFFIDERYFGFSMKVLVAVAILAIGTQTAVLIFLSSAELLKLPDYICYNVSSFSNTVYK